jgi:hypothetical protein
MKPRSASSIACFELEHCQHLRAADRELLNSIENKVKKYENNESLPFKNAALLYKNLTNM